MIKAKKLRIAVIPVKREHTDVSAAIETRDLMMHSIERLKHTQTEFVSISKVATNGILYRVEELDQVTDYLRNEKPDGLFFLHCDFGCEEVIGRLANQFELPVLLWGPRDHPSKEKPLGRETQCGIFASSGLLNRLGIPFDYIVNCDVDDNTFVKGLDSFQRVVSVVKAFRTMRILQIGVRPKPFYSVIYNESDLLNKLGVEIVPVSDSVIKDQAQQMVKAQPALLREEIARMETRMNFCNLKKEMVELTAASKLVVQKIAFENQISGIADDCWNMRAIACNACIKNGELTDYGLPSTCETDVLGAVTSVLLQAAMLHEEATFFADLSIRHPTNENAELLWHCGMFPYSLKHQDSGNMVTPERGGVWRLKDGPITVARLADDKGTYKLFVGEGKSTDGPEVFNTWVWMEVDNWPKWEKKLVYGPYIQHVSGIMAHCKDVIMEAGKYLKAIQIDPI